jgi:2-oxoglutarate ferredoxin oxidoreductase subunit gamma
MEKSNLIGVGVNRIEIIISGIGGQGVVYSANLIAKSALSEYAYVSAIAHYGPESRGSVTTSEVIISNHLDGDLDYPCVESPDIFIAMHQKGFDYHITNNRLHGLSLKYLIYDSTLVTIPKTTMHNIENLNLIGIPASQLAKEKFKNIMMANIILTAALTKTTKIITRNNLEKTFKEMTNSKEHRINLQAIEIGYLKNNISYQSSTTHS